MARPQVEDGYTQIANELMDAFCRCFPGGSQAQILLAILRKTYGWKKKQDSVSISQLEVATGLSRRSIIYALQNLEAKRMITIQRNRGRGHTNEPNTIGIQKNYNLWVVQRNSPQWEKQLRNKRLKYRQKVVQRNNGGSAEKVVQRIENSTPDIGTKNILEGGSADKRGSAEIGKKVVQRLVKDGQFSAPTKETITKENIQKKGNNKGFDLPDFIDREVWDEFIRMRKKIRAPLTDYAARLTISELEKMRGAGEDANEVLRQSIKRCWRGVFPVKEGKVGKGSLPKGYKSPEEHLAGYRARIGAD